MSKACQVKLIQLMNDGDIKNVSHEILNSLLVEELKNLFQHVALTSLNQDCQRRERL